MTSAATGAPRGPLELVVGADFFASDFVPAVCLFSGARTGLKWRTIGVEYKGSGLNALFPSAESGGEPWFVSVTIPCRYWALNGWQMIHTLRTAAILAAAVGGLATLGLGWLHLSDPFHYPDPWAPAEALVLEALAVAAAIGLQLRIKHSVAIQPLPTEGRMRLVFPRHRKAIYEIYAAFFHSYQAAGAPAAEKLHREDDWQDASAGWDEGRPQ